MRKFFLATTLLAMTGCSLIPDYMRPDLPVSGAYPTGPAFAGDMTPTNATPAADIGWRDFFRDPAMQDLIALTLQNNRDLQVAAGNVAAAYSQYEVQHASLFPTIDAVGSGQYERLPADASGFGASINSHVYNLGLSAASYELDLFGRIRSLSSKAREQYFSLAETKLATQISLVAQIVSEYLAWRADREALRISILTVQAQQHSFDLYRLQLTNGIGTALTVAQAETTLRTAEASVQQYTRQLQQDLDQLVLLAGAPLPPSLLAQMMAQQGMATPALFPTIPAGLPSELLQRRPDIRSAEHTLLAANANIGAARAAFFPSVTLTGSLGTESSQLGGLFAAGSLGWLFQPQVSVPIFDAGTNFANLDYAKIQKRIEVANYEKAIQSAFHDVADALAGRGTYARQVEAQRKLVAADQRFFDISKLRADAGADTFLNELVAQNSLFGAQLNLVSVQLAEQQNLVTLYKSLGGGWTERVVTPGG